MTAPFHRLSTLLIVTTLALGACTTQKSAPSTWDATESDWDFAAEDSSGRPEHGPSVRMDDSEALTAAVAALDMDVETMVTPMAKRRGVTDFAGFFRPMAWFPQISGDVDLDDGAGFSTNLSFSELDVDALEPTFAGEVNLRWTIFDVWLSGFSFSSSESALLTGNVTFGNITFGASTLVDTTIEIDNFRAAFGFSLVSTEEGMRFGPTVGVSVFRISAELDAILPGGLVQERVSEHLPIPFVGLHAEIPAALFLITADASLFFIDVDQVQAPFFDLTGMVVWRPVDHFGLFAGYRYLSFDVNGSDAGRTLNISLEMHGPFVGGELRF